MPELPEVETIRKGLQKRIVGRKIVDLVYDTPKMLQPNPKTLLAAVVESKIIKVGRRAKLILIYLSNGKTLAIHLKLSGRLLYRKKTDPKDDWEHVTFKFDNGDELRFCNLRKFGYVRLLTSEKELRELLAGFGPEPLTPEFTLEKFREILKKTSRAAKIVVMDQKKIAGVGNIYANDALFLAKIDPRRPAKELSDQETKKLYQAIKKVLKAGLKYKGASDQYYLDVLGRKGSYQDHFLVYQRTGKKCFDCPGEIKRLKVGGRGTFYCPRCQK